MDSGAGKKTAGKIVIVGVGLIIIAALTLMAKVFMKGFIAGAAVALVGVVCVMIWMHRSGRKDDE